MTINHIEQTCTIGGRPYKIHSSSIEHSLNAAPRMRFGIDVDANEGGLVPLFGERVIITQTGDGTQTYHGTVIDVNPERGNNYTRYMISAEGLTALAGTRRFLEVYPRSGVEAIAGTIWGTYGPNDLVDFIYDDDNDVVWIEEYASSYGSVLDFLTFMTSTTGLVWVDEGESIRIIDPSKKLEIGDIVQGDFIAGSLRASRSGANVFNVARMQAYEYAVVSFNEPINTALNSPESNVPTVLFTSGDRTSGAFCVSTFRGPQSINGLPYEMWDFVSGRVASGLVAEEPSFPISDLEVRYEEDDRVVTTSRPLMRPLRIAGIWIRPPSSVREAIFTSQINIEVTFRRLTWVEVRNKPSIDAFGVRESPVLVNSGELDVVQALEALNQFLSLRAFPPTDVSGELLRADIYPGEIYDLDLPDLGITGNAIVERVWRTYSNGHFRVEATFRKMELSSIAAPLSSSTSIPIRPLNAKPDPLPELMKRLENIENARMDPRGFTGSQWLPGGSQGGPIRANSIFSGDYAWEGEFEVEPLVGGLTLRENF